MERQNAAAPRYEWQITREVDGEERLSRYIGHESESSLGNLFAMWVQNRGDLSQWDGASMFGGIVVLYSDLSPSTVAVWLGLTPDQLSSLPVVEQTIAHVDSNITCKLEGPNGEPMILKRIVDD